MLTYNIHRKCQSTFPLYHFENSGDHLENWSEAKLRYITTTVRTKSGRLIEKRLAISEDDYHQLKSGGSLEKILGKYLGVDDGARIEGWKEPVKPGMKQVTELNVVKNHFLFP
ncbi:unnamed protein product [Protopolystoma xenopodis]|uniref:Uncharacterized protein n=1 Tax=Protopolystoma xenopodis TaxID=117903 RepID=A0A448WWF7_9PLAT|nr:unnamed protein product [Protopolystoma xenopodis]